MQGRRGNRNAEAGDLIELFLVSAVASLLVIRGFLHLTGYPQVGNATLHVAHMLWGGLLMMVALLRRSLYLDRSEARTVAFLGGIGFGTFIDELGKFLTRDNDYFFQPTVAILYIIFVTIFLVLRAVRRRAVLSPAEALANAMDALKDAPHGPIAPETRARILAWLDQAAGFPLERELRAHLSAIATAPAAAPGPYLRLRASLAGWYGRVAEGEWFRRALVGGFVAVGVTDLLLVVRELLGRETGRRMAEQWTTAAAGQAASSVVASVLVVAGIWALRTSRLAAYRWWERAMLVLIFVTQLFRFYDEQFEAIGGLFLNLLVYAGLQFMIGEEEEKLAAAR